MVPWMFVEKREISTQSLLFALGSDDISINPLLDE